MSITIGKRIVVIPTDIGAMTVTTEAVIDYDIEDIVREKAESQAMVLKMANMGRENKVPVFDTNIIPSVFSTEREDLDEY